MNHNQHDQLFKKMLTEDLPGFFRVFLPDIAKQVDFSSLQFLDKELFIALAISDKRESDLVVQANTNDKKPITFLFLIEIEDKEGRTRKKIRLPERLFMYYCLLRTKYGFPIYPVVLYLFKAKEGLQVYTYKDKVFGNAVAELHFQTIGLPKLNAEEYLDKGGAMAGAMAALMDPGSVSPPLHKVRCLEVISTAEASGAMKFLATTSVESYVKLDEEDQAEYEELLYREEHMEAWKITETWTNTWYEKGIEKGRLEGILNGQRITLQKQLRLKFGSIPLSARQRLSTINSRKQLDTLAEKILIATSLDELGLL